VNFEKSSNQLKNIKKDSLWLGEKTHLKKKNESQPGFAGFLLIPVFYLTRISSSTRSTRRASPSLITMDSIKGKAYVTSCAHVNMGWIPTGVRKAFCGAVHHHIEGQTCL